MRRFRRVNRWYAKVMGYFWLPCPKCGQMFGGHECGTVSVEVEMKPPVLAGLGPVHILNRPARRICCWRHETQTDNPLP